jgi:hypothetical protein
MKKLLNTLAFTLALNFIALVALLSYLYATGALTREKIAAIKVVMYPAATQATQAATVTTLGDDDKKAGSAAATQPTIKLDELLARVAGRPAGEQVEFIQRTFDAQAVQVDRRLREVQAREDALARAQQALDEARRQFTAQQARLDERERALSKDAEDKGFSDSLALYDSMQAKQVKDVFAGLDDPTVTRYLRAMEPGRAAKILKEFKSPEETQRVQRLIEAIRGRQQPPSAQPPTPSATAGTQ